MHKLPVKLDDSSNPVRTRGEEGCAEMQRVLLLPKAGTGHDADARGVEKTQRVELVRGPSFLAGLRHGRTRQVDGREEIHGSLWFLTLDPFHLLKGRVDGFGASVQAREDVVVLPSVQLVARFPLARWIHHQLHRALPGHGRT